MQAPHPVRRVSAPSQRAPVARAVGVGDGGYFVPETPVQRLNVESRRETSGMKDRLSSCGAGGAGVGFCAVVRASGRARISSGMGGGPTAVLGAVSRSEERRVGKAWRSRG